MAAKTKKTSNGLVASALLMLFALLWLTVSTPFVYAVQQKALLKEKTADGKAAKASNPLAGTNEEKSESGVNSISEYLHEIELPGALVTALLKWEKCHPADLYFAYHPELVCPPPDMAV